MDIIGYSHHVTRYTTGGTRGEGIERPDRYRSLVEQSQGWPAGDCCVIVGHMIRTHRISSPDTPGIASLLFRFVVFLLLASTVPGCGDDSGPRDGSPSDSTMVDAPIDGGADGNLASEGEVCGSSMADQDAGARMCRPDLVCCYPCGIPGCLDRCQVPCDAGPACAGGCLLVP